MHFINYFSYHPFICTYVPIGAIRVPRCLVIVDIFYVYASAMFEFIEEMLPNFSKIF
jgi:hypothetical protein